MPYHEDDDYNSPYTRPPRAHKLNTHAPGNEERALEAKLVVMGNTGVGKTSLVTRYTENTFNARLTATTGAVFVSHKTEFAGFQVKLQIWDTAGQERFRSLAPIYYRGANAAIVMYDLTRLESFNDVRIWIEELRKNCDPDLLIYIVGSKSDLKSARQITPDRVRATLAKWFPPVPSSTSIHAPAMRSGNSNINALNLNAYLRPRFTSLASAYTANSGSSAGSGPPSRGAGLMRANTATAARLGASVGDSGGAASPSRSKSLSAQIPGRQGAVSKLPRKDGIRFNSLQSFDALPAAGGASAGRPGSSNGFTNGQNGRGHHRERSWGPSGLSLNLNMNLSGAGPKSASALSFPRFLGRGSEEAVTDEDEDDESGAAAEIEENETEWGLGQHMRLFEVSAKDASGIDSLFSAILGAVIERREVIETERRARERDSILLHASYGPVLEEDEGKEKENPRSWACC